MGSRLVKFNVKPNENEQIEAIVKVPEEPRSVIHGIVKDHTGKIVKDAVVKLFELKHPPCNMKPLTHTFTDKCGQFLFGPLCPNKVYVIKVWIDNVKIRKIVIDDDNCEDECDDSCHDNCKDGCKNSYYVTFNNEYEDE